MPFCGSVRRPFWILRSLRIELGRDMTRLRMGILGQGAVYVFMWRPEFFRSPSQVERARVRFQYFDCACSAYLRGNLDSDCYGCGIEHRSPLWVLLISPRIPAQCPDIAPMGAGRNLGALADAGVQLLTEVRQYILSGLAT